MKSVIIIIIIKCYISKLMDFQKLQSKYVTNNLKNGQHKNGNNFINKFNTLPSSLYSNEIQDELELLKVIKFCLDILLF